MALFGEGGDDEERTEDPSPKKLDKAWREGDVPHSADLAAAIQSLAAAAGLAALAGGLWESMQTTLGEGLERGLSGAVGVAGTPEGAQALGRQAIVGVARLALPFLGVMAAAAIVGGLGQHRPVFSLAKVGPQLSRLNPLTGLGRIVSGESVKGLLVSLLKLAVVGAALWSPVNGAVSTLAGALQGGLRAGIARGAELAGDLLWAGAAAMLVMGGLDLFLTRWRWMKRLNMTRQELRQEQKEDDGDPHVKGRMRGLMRQARQRRKMLQAVKTADVVVTNPTHVAVALEYDRQNMGAPRVVAKGVDALAQRIKRLAREAGVVVVEEPPLARALNKSVPVGGEVPEKLYQAVARVLAFAYRLRGGKR